MLVVRSRSSVSPSRRPDLSFLQRCLLSSASRRWCKARRGWSRIRSPGASAAESGFNTRALWALSHLPLGLSVPTDSESCALGLCQFRLFASVMSSLSITRSCPDCLQGSAGQLCCQARGWAGVSIWAAIQWSITI